MSGYGHDESAPTPNGLFATNFVGVCGYFTDCSPRIHGTNMVYWGGMKGKTSKGTMRNSLFSQHLRG
ncbi:hypothetical protein [Prevotella pallens]|uniref:hypothetical protein n=1 Tax=Prevotella pallens TaxID=60133 RepID=UPI003C77113F